MTVTTIVELPTAGTKQGGWEVITPLEGDSNVGKFDEVRLQHFCRQTIKTISLAEWAAGDMPTCRRGEMWHLRPGDVAGRRVVIERAGVREYAREGRPPARFPMYRARCLPCGTEQEVWGSDLIKALRGEGADTCRSCAGRDMWADPGYRARAIEGRHGHREAAEAAPNAVEAGGEASAGDGPEEGRDGAQDGLAAPSLASGGLDIEGVARRLEAVAAWVEDSRQPLPSKNVKSSLEALRSGAELLRAGAAVPVETPGDFHADDNTIRRAHAALELLEDSARRLDLVG